MRAQALEGANLQRVAAAAAPALAALLRALTPPQRAECSRTTAELLWCFIFPYELVRLIALQGQRWVPGPAPDTVAKFWQGAAEHPSLAATAEALHLLHTDEPSKEIDGWLVGRALWVHFSKAAEGDAVNHAICSALISSLSLQQYAIDSLASAALSNQGSVPQDIAWHCVGFVNLVASAVSSGRISDARMSALLARDFILVRMRRIAEGTEGFQDEGSLLLVLVLSIWRNFGSSRRMPGGSPEALRAAQRALLGVLRQGAALLVLAEVPPAQQQRALRRARREGFYQVQPSQELSQNLI